VGQLGQLGTSNQARNGKPVPYISHLIAGLLHDSIEDGGQSQASIAERFGEQEETQALIPGTSAVLPPRSPYSATGWQYLL
jgi:hypothetical protein